MALVIKNVRVFENAGVNILGTASSGFPYSRRVRAYGLTETRFAHRRCTQRVAQTLAVQNRLDRQQGLVLRQGQEDRSKSTLQILNVLNTQNVLNIYPFTGSPTDDGYLSSSRGQQAILFTTNAQSFADLYNVSMVNPFNFSIPRQIRLGIRLGL